MQGYPDTTEEASDLPEVFKINKAGLPVKVFLLRQKLYRKSKQEPNIVRGPAKDCGRQISRKPDAGNPPVRFEEGGLNLRHHGSSAAARLSPLLYRSFFTVYFGWHTACRDFFRPAIPPQARATAQSNGTAHS